MRQQEQQNEEKRRGMQHSGAKEKSAGRCRRFGRWIKTVFLIRKEYVPGDSCRFIWQNVPQVQRSFVHYRIGHMICNLVVLCFSVLGITVPYSKQVCENQPLVLCIGQYVRLQPEWFFYVTKIGLILNFVQSLWGLILTLRTYSRQKRDHDRIKVFFVAADTGHIAAQEKDKNVDHLEAQWIKPPHRRESKSPLSYRITEDSPAQPKEVAVLKSFFLPTERNSIPESVVGKERQEKPKTSAFEDPPNVLIVTSSKDAGSSRSRSLSYAAPPASKEHRILSKTGFYWALHTNSVCSLILINMVYWVVVWPKTPTYPRVYLIQINEHGLNLPLMLIDYCVVAFPVNLSHMLFVTTFLSSYVLLTYLIYLAGGKNYDHSAHYLYTFMDWKKPRRSVIVCFLLVVLCDIFLLLILIADHYKFKLRPKPLSNVHHTDASPKNHFV